jgi:hypothetical protein
MVDKQKLKPNEEKLVACKVCMKEVPASAAKSEEAADYVFYFCGSVCFEKWRRKGDRGDN